VDDVTLESGRWATQAGQIVMASDPAPGETVMMPLGSRISLTGKPGSPQLTIVGFANSVTSIEVHRYVLPIVASAADLTLPHSFLSVYGVWQLAGLALAGVAIAVLGALLPAGWAAGIRTATALRAE
jgi:hypothetical protein